MSADAFYDEICDRLATVRRRERRTRLAVGLIRTGLALLAIVLAIVLIDILVLSRLVQEPWVNRLCRGILLLAGLGWVGWTAWRQILLPLRRPLSDDDLALRIEARNPVLRGRLIATVQLGRDRVEGLPLSSEELFAVLEEETRDRVGGLDFAAIVDRATLRRVALWGGGSLALVLVLGTWFADYTRVVAGRMVLSGEEYPTAVRIVSVTPGTAVPQGEAFTAEIVLDTGRSIPDAVFLHVRGQDGAVMVLTAAAGSAPGRFTCTIDPVVEALAFRPVAGDARWPRWERLGLRQRPAVATLAVTATPPAYTGRPAQTLATGDLAVLAGTRVAVRVGASKPLATADMLVRSGDAAPRRIAMTVADDGAAATGAFTVDASGAWWIELRDREELANRQPPQYRLNALPDEPPRIEPLPPTRDRGVVPASVWKQPFRVRDDLAIASAEICYRIEKVAKRDEGDDLAARGAAAAKVPPPPDGRLAVPGFSAGKAQAEIAAVLELAALKLTPGHDRLVWWLEVLDNRQPEPNRARSQDVVFTVVDPAVLRAQLERDRDEALQALEQAEQRLQASQQRLSTLTAPK